MDYKETLNLPQTKFPMRGNLSQKEPEIEKEWQNKDIYGLLRKKQKGKPKYVLHDGPPYANGHIHIGHSLNKILKDIILKYKTMRGFDTPFIVGWDCHGLPVEHQLFKQLKIDKDQISQQDFRAKAKDYAQRFVQIQKEEFKRLGVFADWENSYLTMDKGYEFKIIQAFNRLFKRGYIYRELKPVYWCPNCQTALAEAEVEYKDVSSPSVYVKFKLQASTPFPLPFSLYPSLSFVVWTTTPWTLPANVAVALHPQAEYAFVKTAKRKEQSVNQGEVLIIAKALVRQVMQKAGIKDYEIIKTLKGEELKGLECRHPWIERDSKVVLADFVDLKQGTGCVHIAPGHGIEDYEVGLKYKLPIISPVDKKGRFTGDVQFFKGMDVFSANKEIVKKLQREEMLLPVEEEIEHSYPHCWRCKKEVIFRATKQWFMKVDHLNLRERSISFANNQIDWIPAWGKKRMTNMLLFRPDWCLSRQRYWGVPIPVFYCANCGKELVNEEVLNRVEELVKKEGIEGWFNRSVEEILPRDITCKECGGKQFISLEKPTKQSKGSVHSVAERAKGSLRGFIKGEDILDVWFDSGISHYAVLEDSGDLTYPADLYLEGSDQHRGWFQSSLLTGVALKGSSPFKAVLTHGFVVDGEGKKMSKSLGNVISPQEIIQENGADILRLWVASADYNEDIKLSSSILDTTVQSYRRIRNTLRFLLSNLFDFDHQKNRIEYSKLMEIDKWALGESEILLKEVTAAYEEFQFYKVCQLLQNFCAIKMSALYLDILKDRLYTFAKDSSERRAAQTVLYQILLTLTKIIAPILCFTAEEVWRYIPGIKEESVHLCSWPKLEKKVDKQLKEKWDRLFEIRNKVCERLEEKRIEKEIGSPLEAKVVLKVGNENLRNFLLESKKDLPSIFVVSQTEVKEGKEDLEIIIEHAKGNKCARCWNYSESVGKDKRYPDLCERCVKVLQS